VQKAASGIRTIAWLKTGEKDIAVAERARARGLESRLSHGIHNATLIVEPWFLVLRVVLRLSYAVESKFWRQY
jgi:phosphopantothenoylcysteine synthetase/decarboxylase